VVDPDHEAVTAAPARDQRGFSLLEALIGLTVFLFVLLAVLSTYEVQRALYAKSERKVDVQQNARLAMAEIAREIRHAGYFPENFSPSPPSPALANSIHVATDSVLVIHGDADGTGSSNLFLYCLDGSVLRRRRAAPGSAGAYTCGGGEVVAENIASLRFSYLDATSAALPSASATTFALDGQAAGTPPTFDDTDERSAVRRIVISLVARQDNHVQGPQTYTLTSDVWLRNPNTG
jgi:Tfp pilus assembly protein PilW